MLYDLVIIGSSMVGASLACALRDTSLQIALIDAAPLTIEDPRLIALNDSSCCLFKNLNLWEKIAPYATAIQQVHVSHKGRFGITRLAAEEIGLTSLGHVVPAHYINAALQNVLFSAKNITILRPAKLKALSQTDAHAALTLATASGEQEIEGKIIVGADGSDSMVRKLTDIPTDVIDYQQSAIVTITELQKSHQQIAYERFHQTGAVAMLPLMGQQCATIWTDSHASISSLMQLDDTEFRLALQKQFGYRLGCLIKTNKRHVFPLQQLRAKQWIKQNVILIGNAAHTLHPIAAQGLNLALYEIAILAETILEQTQHQKTLSLQPLQEKIDARQQISARLSHRLTWLFTTDFFMINKIRELSMIGLDIFPFVKRHFILRALGRTHYVPQLLLEKGYA